MTDKALKERAEPLQRRGECDGISGTIDKLLERTTLQWPPGGGDADRTEPERLAAAQADAAEEERQSPACTSGLGLKEVSRRTARAVESVIIKYVLEEVGGNRVEAARRLQISYKALLYKIEMYQLGGPRPAPRLDAQLGQSRPESRSASRKEMV